MPGEVGLGGRLHVPRVVPLQQLGHGHALGSAWRISPCWVTNRASSICAVAKVARAEATADGLSSTWIVPAGAPLAAVPALAEEVVADPEGSGFAARQILVEVVFADLDLLALRPEPVAAQAAGGDLALHGRRAHAQLTRPPRPWRTGAAACSRRAASRRQIELDADPLGVLALDPPRSGRAARPGFGPRRRPSRPCCSPAPVTVIPRRCWQSSARLKSAMTFTLTSSQGS